MQAFHQAGDVLIQVEVTVSVDGYSSGVGVEAGDFDDFPVPALHLGADFVDFPENRGVLFVHGGLHAQNVPARCQVNLQGFAGLAFQTLNVPFAVVGVFLNLHLLEEGLTVDGDAPCGVGIGLVVLLDLEGQVIVAVLGNGELPGDFLTDVAPGVLADGVVVHYLGAGGGYMDLGGIVGGEEGQAVFQVALLRLKFSQVAAGVLTVPGGQGFQVSGSLGRIGKAQALQYQGRLVQPQGNLMVAFAEIKVHGLGVMVLGVADEAALPKLLLQKAGPQLVALQVYGEAVILQVHVGFIQVDFAQVHILNIGVGGLAVQEDVNDDVIVVAGHSAVVEGQLVEARFGNGKVPGDGTSGFIPPEHGAFTGEIRSIGTGILLGGEVGGVNQNLGIRPDPKTAAAVQIVVVAAQIQVGLG